MIPLEPTEEVECLICHDDMPIDEAFEFMDTMYVCGLAYSPECYAEWNDREHVESEFYD